jgi:NitT/TauT family transport system ATP-binding protein
VTTSLKVIPAARQAEEKPPVLEIRDLGKVFKADPSFLTVLSGISFDVAHGEMLCLLGPSGCGKTTILKILAGFLQPDTGRIRLKGHPVGKPGPKCCMVFQEDALFPWLTVSENIAMGLQKKRMARREKNEMVARYLDLVGLYAFRNYLPRQISGGMKQRVALARVLILEPEVLLMDEPFAALDAQTREEMQQLLLDLWLRICPSIVFVTHDVREAVTLADRVVVMDKNPGRVKEAFPIRLERPRSISGGGFQKTCAALYDLLRTSR